MNGTVPLSSRTKSGRIDLDHERNSRAARRRRVEQLRDEEQARQNARAQAMRAQLSLQKEAARYAEATRVVTSHANAVADRQRVAVATERSARLDAEVVQETKARTVAAAQRAAELRKEAAAQAASERAERGAERRAARERERGQEAEAEEPAGGDDATPRSARRKARPSAQSLAEEKAAKERRDRERAALRLEGDRAILRQQRELESKAKARHEHTARQKQEVAAARKEELAARQRLIAEEKQQVQFLLQQRELRERSVPRVHPRRPKLGAVPYASKTPELCGWAGDGRVPDGTAAGQHVPEPAQDVTEGEEQPPGVGAEQQEQPAAAVAAESSRSGQFNPNTSLTPRANPNAGGVHATLWRAISRGASLLDERAAVQATLPKGSSLSGWRGWSRAQPPLEPQPPRHRGHTAPARPRSYGRLNREASANAVAPWPSSLSVGSSDEEGLGEEISAGTRTDYSGSLEEAAMLAKETVDAVRQLPTSRSEAEAVRGLLRSTTQEQAQAEREGEQSEGQADGEPEDPQTEAGTGAEAEEEAGAEQSGSETVEQEAGDVEGGGAPESECEGEATLFVHPTTGSDGTFIAVEPYASLVLEPTTVTVPPPPQLRELEPRLVRTPRPRSVPRAGNLPLPDRSQVRCTSARVVGAAREMPQSRANSARVRSTGGTSHTESMQDILPQGPQGGSRSVGMYIGGKSAVLAESGHTTVNRTATRAPATPGLSSPRRRRRQAAKEEAQVGEQWKPLADGEPKEEEEDEEDGVSLGPFGESTSTVLQQPPPLAGAISNVYRDEIQPPIEVDRRRLKCSTGSRKLRSNLTVAQVKVQQDSIAAHIARVYARLPSPAIGTIHAASVFAPGSRLRQQTDEPHLPPGPVDPHMFSNEPAAENHAGLTPNARPNRARVAQAQRQQHLQQQSERASEPALWPVQHATSQLLMNGGIAGDSRPESCGMEAQGAAIGRGMAARPSTAAADGGALWVLA